MTETDKRPLQQRSSQELERNLEQGNYRGRKKTLAEQTLRERRLDEANADKHFATRRERGKLLAAWVASLAAAGTLIWAMLDSLWR
jgi:hypothetical protein